MAVGGSITAARFTTMKNTIQSEIQSRAYTGAINTQYNTNLFSPTPASGVQIAAAGHYNQLIADISKINPTGFSTIAGGSVTITEASLVALETKINAMAAYNIASTTSTDCSSSCTGGCYTGCYNTCRTTCTGTCTVTCGGNCTGSCTGTCKNTCSATCADDCYTGCYGNK